MGAGSAEGARYYRHPAVQARIREYCGATPGRPATCGFVSQLRPDGFVTWATATRASAGSLPVFFDSGWDISRSLLDSQSLIVYFEVDLDDPLAPAYALSRPAQAFFDLEPVYRAVNDELGRLRLPLLDLMTGRGYHFSGQVPLTAPIVDRLAEQAPPGGPWLDRAYTGLGMVLEYLAHTVTRRSASQVPVVLNGVEVGRGGVGREAVSLDLSGYGDPIAERQMRVAFGTYQNHLVRPDQFGALTSEVPVLVAVPRRSQSLLWMLENGRTPDQARVLATRDNAYLPDVTPGIERLVEEYQASRLHGFHRDFYLEAARWIDEPARPADYREVALLPCVAQALRYPNDALLKPTMLQHLTRYLMSRGWSAARVAELVWSKYMSDYGWGDRWTRLDPRRRAEFDVRVFAGALATGLDTAIDFNCVSNQEKGLCPQSGCAHDLRVDRRRLLERLGV